MKRTHLIPVFLLLFARLTFGQEATLHDSLMAMSEAENYKKLAKFTEERLKDDPYDYYLLLYSFESQLAIGEVELALDRMATAIAVYPDSGMLYNTRGSLMLAARQFDQALEDYTQVLRVAQNDESRKVAYVNMAAVHLSIRDIEKATELLLSAYELDSTDVAVLINLAGAYSDQGRSEEAIQYLERVIELDSTRLAAFTNLGFIYSELEDYEKALANFNRVLEKQPRDAYTLNNRGYVKLQMGDKKGALKDINRSLEINPMNSYAFRNRALVHLAQNKKKDACEDLQSARENDFSVMYGDEVEQLIKQHCK